MDKTMSNSPSFTAKVVLVTGVSSGIGRATASAFGRSGAKLVLGDLNEEAAATASLVTEAGDEALLRAPVPATNGRDRRGGMTGPETQQRSKQQQARDRTSRHL
jgi:NAD(P)-dependent dehydrogenase (short-subunit alcohol dehydrogenase family)